MAFRRRKRVGNPSPRDSNSRASEVDGSWGTRARISATVSSRGWWMNRWLDDNYIYIYIYNVYIYIYMYTHDIYIYIASVMLCIWLDDIGCGYPMKNHHFPMVFPMGFPMVFHQWPRYINHHINIPLNHHLPIVFLKPIHEYPINIPWISQYDLIKSHVKPPLSYGKIP